MFQNVSWQLYYRSLFFCHDVASMKVFDFNFIFCNLRSQSCPWHFFVKTSAMSEKEKNLINAIIVEIISSERNVPKLPWGRFLSRSKIELWKDPGFGNCWPIIDSVSERLLSFCSKDLKTREVVKHWGSVPASHPAALGSNLSIPARHSLNLFLMLLRFIDRVT